ncbi:MAG: ATP-dependent DNA helicase RecG [Clostridiales bacterium]|jgi:ATP-dependent DNA helicase RecG|nr:ATP-dependent DNA helicase RecG [Clostridiales bacterium]
MQLTDIKGIGKAYLQKLNLLGIFFVEDLVNFLPSKYIDFKVFGSADSFKAGQFVFFRARVTKAEYNPKKKTVKAVLDIRDGKDENVTKLTAVWFNRPYIKEKLVKDELFRFFGKITEYKESLLLSNPMFENDAAPKALTGIMPIYRTKGLIPQGIMRNFIKNALEYYNSTHISEYSSYLRADAIHEDGAYVPLMKCADAYLKAHAPESVENACAAQRRIAVEDFTGLIFTYKTLKARENLRRDEYAADKSIAGEYVSALPFDLTASQRRALDEILEDMAGKKYMNRLLMGDVGSGKTAVALGAAFYAVKSGVQCAFLAPTELLARQHFEFTKKIFSDFNINISFLSAALDAKERRRVESEIQNGAADIVVGTHSLFSKGTVYKNLGLIIIDEQQRFGVGEKNALKEKAENADVLSLSATPIPRALSLAFMGELDVSTIERRRKIDEMIITRIVPESKKDDMFNYIRLKAKESVQSYIVAPRIEDVEGIETDTVKSLYKELKEGIFKDVRTAVLHGKISAAERERVMRSFKDGETDVIIGTTVIEVGIDVGNAGIMAVINADNYGLATLHQLRGRVGRGDKKSYCFLHTTKTDNARLEALLKHGDGFAVAECDFNMRGGGNFLGTRQAGSFENLNAYIIEIDKDLIAEAKLIADGIKINEETVRALREINYTKYYNIIKDSVFM